MQEFSLEDFSDDTIDTVIDTLCIHQQVEVEISYTSDFRSAKILREIVDRICKKCGVNPKWRTRLVLIIDELNNNAIEYGSKPGETNIFLLVLHKNDDESFYIESSVKDTGRGGQAKTAHDMEKLRDFHDGKDFTSHNSIRGRGLFLIISHLVDSLYFKDNVPSGLIVGIQKVLGKDSG